jgi:histone H2A
VVSRSSKAGLQFPIGRITHFLKAGKYVQRVGAGTPVYLSAVLEYLAAEVHASLPHSVAPRNPLLLDRYWGTQFLMPLWPCHPMQVLELAGNVAHDNKKSRIVPRRIQLTVCNDEELSRLLGAVTITARGNRL